MAKKEESPVLVVESRTKEFIAGFKGPEGTAMRSSGDLCEAVSAAVAKTLEKAVQRASSNGRSTVRPEDV